MTFRPAIMSFGTLSKFLIAALLAVTVIGTGSSLTWITKINTLSTSWQAHERGVARKSAFLNLMRGSLGYGGMIHNLKNYLLRGDVHRLIKVHKNVLKIKVAISGYRTIGLSEMEEASLRDLEAVLDKYQRAAATAESLVLKGFDPRAVDRKIIVADSPALAALRHLDNAVVSLRQKNQLEITDQTADLRRTILASAGGFSLFLVLLTIILGWGARYRLVFPLERLVAAFEGIDPNTSEKTRLPIRDPKGKNELDLLAGAGNRFLEAVDNHLAERKQAEEALLAAKIEAETANSAKSEFLAAMSHELRTPLNAILGFAQMLSHQYFGPINEKYREYADDIHSSGDHLLTLVNEILDLSTIEAGKQSMDKENLSTEEIIRECERIVQGKARSNGIDLVMEVPKNLPPLYADKQASMQILLNLLSNAVKFTPEGGRITVSAKASEKDITLKVVDTGMGIPADKLPKLTDPFTRGEYDPYLAEKGWGLGLTITKSLIDLHDGKLDIRSKVGKGTTVTVTFPNGAP